MIALIYLRRQEELLGLTKEEARIKELADQTSSETRARKLYDRERNISAREIIKDLEAEIDLKRQSPWLSEEEARVLELIAQGYDKEMAVKQAGAEQTDRELDAIKNSIDMLKEAGISLAASSLIDFAHDLGNAFRDGTASLEAFSEATKNMLRSLVDAMPQLLLNVGLQLISAGQWPTGLALIAASWLMSFISGLMPEAEKDKNNDEYEKLNQIRQQITDLIAAQNGNGGDVYINVINNSSSDITTQQETKEDGAKEIAVMVDNIVQNGIATGKYDRAFGAQAARNRGKSITA
jgi:DNA-binding CsgD family transcriptional regulator